MFAATLSTMPPPSSSQRGQAAVELVAILPAVALVLAIAGQALLAGYAFWEARTAARAAARATAVGGDARAAALAHLPGMLEPGLRVRASDAGDARVTLRVPAVVAALALGSVSASAHFEPQGG
jgi:hypothetical protein